MTQPTSDTLRARLLELERDGLRRSLGPLPRGTVDFCSNDYLGLAAHPLLTDALRQHAARAGAGAARLVGADLPQHRELEQRLATYKATEAALLFSTGYQANIGTIAALVGAPDAVYSDRLNHASIIDGCRLSRATIRIYDHLDTAHLELLLRRDAGAFRRRLLISETLFGMDGHLAPLAELHALARAHDCWLMFDEAHATGLWGPTGAGLTEARGVAPDVQVLTFGKALGSFGAAALGSRALVDYLLNTARTFIYTTALPPAICAATSAALDLVASDHGAALRATLWRNVHHLRTQLGRRGLLPPDAPPTPVHPLIVGSPERATSLSRSLLRRGYFVQAIRPPTVPPGTSRLRLSLSARHTTQQIDGLLAALDDILPDTLAAAPLDTSAPSLPEPPRGA